MDINNNTIINVCSYEPCSIIASSNVQDYTFEPCESLYAPIIIPMSAVEIKNIHSKSKVFSDGYLTFEDDCKEDVYNYLKIRDWQDILTQQDIVDTLLHSSKEKLQRIIDINSLSYFERVRGVYIALKQSKADMSLRTVEVVEARYKELLRDKFKSSIELRDINFKTEADKKKDLIEEKEKTIEEKDKEIKALSEQMEELKAMILQMQNNNVKGEKFDNNADNGETAEKPKRGRPSKNK